MRRLQFAWRIGLVALFAVPVSLATLNPAQARQECFVDSVDAEDDEFDVEGVVPGQHDPASGGCVPASAIDCGPNPYAFNAVGGHWERLFYEKCWHDNKDEFERIFHGMNYAEVQAQLNEFGIGGLTHDEQVISLLEHEYETEESGNTFPYCPEGFELNADGSSCEQDAPPNCGGNPYLYDPFRDDGEGSWQRVFNKWCFDQNRDPYEIIFHKHNFESVYFNLVELGLQDLSHDEVVAELAALGYWNLEGSYKPDGAPFFFRLD